MERGVQGRFILRRTSPEPFQAFVPKDLPPDPPLRCDEAMQDRLERANRALGRLDGMGTLLPDLSLFLYFYVRKEAVLSSQIEGTQSSLADLLLYENAETPGVPVDDVREVSNYVAALQHGLDRIHADAPLTGRLIREIHGILMQSGRGSQQQPGEFRRSQNWLGGGRPGNAKFVPPPPEEVLPSIAALEKFLHDADRRTPTLVKAALAHVQFETIHPFLDGNGRTGRLLIPLILCYERALSEPLLYLSLYFKERRDTYYDLLQRTRMEGDWETWLEFFLDGVEVTAESASETARQVLILFRKDRENIETMGRGSGTLLRLHNLLQKKVMISIASAADALGISKPAAAAALQRLEAAGLVQERSGKLRKRVYAYSAYLEILSGGTEAPF